MPGPHEGAKLVRAVCDMWELEAPAGFEPENGGFVDSTDHQETDQNSRVLAVFAPHDLGGDALRLAL